MKTSSVLLLLLIWSTLCGAGCGVVSISQPGARGPRILPTAEIPEVVKRIPTYTRLSYSGLCFFKGRLYVATNIGLVEFENAEPSNLYKWHDKDDVISGPWLDVADDALWAMHDGLGKLIRFDGTTWKMIDLPTPERGYTRGDLLRGFRGVGTKDGFWFEGGGHAWRWNNSTSSWSGIPAPVGGTTHQLVPLDGGLLAITSAYPVVIQGYTDGWKQLSEQPVEGFRIEQSAIAKDQGFVCTEDGRIFRITTKGIDPIASPGDCEAIAVSPSGTLISSFRGTGLFEYSDGWRMKFESPYGPKAHEQWAKLAVTETQYAFSVTAKPQGYGESKMYPGQTSLWVSVEGRLVPVSLEN